MTSCTEILPAQVCERIAPLIGQQPTEQQIVTTLFGVLVVVMFALDHYNVPTYAKTTIGEFIELAPESLTSHPRYVRGLFTYIALMLGFYFVLLIIGPTAIAPILSFGSTPDKPSAPIDSSVWPLAATSIITLIGSRDDNKYLGRLEGWIRSIAHEVAYIPYAVTYLASTLDGSFLLTPADLSAAGMLTNENESIIRESQEGFRQNWIRAEYLYSRLEQLSNQDDDRFQKLTKTPESARAFDFIREQRSALVRELMRDDPELAVAKKIEAFKSALSVFLASLLWSGCDSESSINAKLASLKLNVSAPEPRSLATFMSYMLIYLGGTALVLKVLLQLRDMVGIHDGSIALQWHLTLAFLVFLTTAFFVTRWREKKLTSGEWRYKSDVVLRGGVVCAIASAVTSATMAFAWHQGGIGSFYAMLMVSVGMALPSALLFQCLMRWAATSPPTDEAVEAKVASSAKSFDLIKTAGLASLLYFAVAFIAIAGPLYWLSSYVVIAVSPPQIVEAAKASLKDIRLAYGAGNAEDKWFTESVPLAMVANLEKDLEKVRQDLATGNYGSTTISDTLIACYKLGRLPSGVEMFAANCESNNLQSVDQQGNVYRSLYSVQGNVSALTTQYDAIKSYNLLTSFRNGWGVALLAGAIWATLACVFAVSVLFYRRQELWDSLAAKKLPDFVPTLLNEREAWLGRPLLDLGRLSPLEALRYSVFRSRLADQIKTQGGQPVVPRLRAVV